MRKLLLALVIAFALTIPASAYAFLPFGGVITGITKCPCGGGDMLAVLGIPPILSGVYVELPKTINHLVGYNRVGAFILGTYLPGAGCCGVPANGTIIMKGTSL